QHVDGIGYSLSASFGNYTLSISNSCDYPPLPEVEDITVCEGESTLIAPGIPEMPDAISSEVFYDFNLPAPDVLIAQNSDPTVMTGGAAVYGPGLTGPTTFSGCGSDPGQAMAATHWTELTEEDAVAAGDYFEFPVANSHAENTLLIAEFSFD
ncbi:hypothetical protein RZS08_18300, partial [Arthrospira platensis SPKY1]|nr:hypothetical protein [Arthrospira platensis SPKY1]